MRISGLLPLLVWAGLTTAAHAVEIYAGGSVSSPMEGRVGREGQTPEGDVGFDVRAGLQITSLLGAELAWHDLGDVTWCQGCFDAGGAAGTKVWSAGATVGLTLGRVRPFFKLGWFHAVTDGSEQSFAGPRTMQVREDGVFGEAGLRAFLGRHVALRLGYERFDFDAEGDGALAFGAECRF
jgi:hypothetical protein